MSFDNITILRRAKLFRDLPVPVIEKMSSIVLRRRVAQDQVLFSQGDAGDALYGVISGNIRISAASRVGKEIFLSVMQAGDTFGEIALLDGRPRTANATVIDDTELVIVPRQDFLSLLEQETLLSHHVISLLCERIRWTSRWAEESALLTTRARLARRMLSLASLHGRPSEGETTLKISQEDLARFLGLSRQVVNQQLQEWKAMGLIDTKRAQILFKNSAALQAIATDIDTA